MGSISKFLGLQRSFSHTDLMQLSMDLRTQLDRAKAIQAKGGEAPLTHLVSYRGTVRASQSNDPISTKRHQRSFDRLEKYLLRDGHRYHPDDVNRALTAIRIMRGQNKRFSVAALATLQERVAELMDPEACAKLLAARRSTKAIFVGVVDHIAARRGKADPSERVSDADRTTAQNDLADARRCVMTCQDHFGQQCLPVENGALPLAPAQDEEPSGMDDDKSALAAWLNAALERHPETKGLVASRLVAKLLHDEPKRLADQAQQLFQLRAQVAAGTARRLDLIRLDLLAKKQADDILRYISRLAVVGELLANKFPTNKVPPEFYSKLVQCGLSWAILASTCLNKGSEFMDMRRFAEATSAQAQNLLSPPTSVVPPVPVMRPDAELTNSEWLEQFPDSPRLGPMKDGPSPKGTDDRFLEDLVANGGLSSPRRPSERHRLGDDQSDQEWLDAVIEEGRQRASSTRRTLEQLAEDTPPTVDPRQRLTRPIRRSRAPSDLEVPEARQTAPHSADGGLLPTDSATLERLLVQQDDRGTRLSSAKLLTDELVAESAPSTPRVGGNDGADAGGTGSRRADIDGPMADSVKVDGATSDTKKSDLFSDWKQYPDGSIDLFRTLEEDSVPYTFLEKLKNRLR